MLDLSLLKFFTQYFFISQKSFFLLLSFPLLFFIYRTFHKIGRFRYRYIYTNFEIREKVGDYFNYNWKFQFPDRIKFNLYLLDNANRFQIEDFKKIGRFNLSF